MCVCGGVGRHQSGRKMEANAARRRRSSRRAQKSNKNWNDNVTDSDVGHVAIQRYRL